MKPGDPHGPMGLPVSINEKYSRALRGKKSNHTGMVKKTASSVGKGTLTHIEGGYSMPPPRKKKPQTRARPTLGGQGGTVRLGYQVNSDGVMVLCEEEQAIISAVLELRAKGAKVTQIQRHLEASGFTGRSGKPLHTSQIYRIINQNGGRGLRA